MEMSDLKACREERGLSLQDVYQKTRICVKYLAAIEQADFASLPPPVYTRKFIRDYASLLGQDSAPYLHAYENYHNSKLASTLIALDESKEQKCQSVQNGKTIYRFRYLIFSLGLIILLMLALFSSFLVSDRRESLENLTTPLTTGRDEASVPGDRSLAKSKDLPSPQTNVTPGKPLPPQRYHLSIEAREVTWLRIRVDHNPPYQLLLNPGEKIERFADQRLAIDIGNAGGVILMFQGKDMGSLGKPGEVVHIRLP